MRAVMRRGLVGMGDSRGRFEGDGLWVWVGEGIES